MYEIETQTRIGIPPIPLAIDFACGIVSLGSCFSDEMGQRMSDSGFHIEQNPFGTLYNPFSIATALRRLMDDSEITAADLVQHEGLWHSWHHHGSFSRPTQEECLAACNARIHQAHAALKEASLLMVTFGSAWVYDLADGRGTVANCHKLPQELFVRHRLSVDDIVARWRPLLDELHALFPSLHTLFTVSPIRHIGDGLHGNQLSKSTLLLAIEQLLSTSNSQPSTYYFPAYEIVLDELRDYRFFDEKMTHPTDLAVDVVWDRFQHAAMTPAVRQQAHFNMKQHKREQHIPLHPSSDNN